MLNRKVAMDLGEAIYCSEQLTKALKAYESETNGISNVNRKWQGLKAYEDVVYWSNRVSLTVPFI